LDVLCREFFELDPSSVILKLKGSDDLSWCKDHNKDEKPVTKYNLDEFKKFYMEKRMLGNEASLSRLKGIRDGFGVVKLQKLEVLSGGMLRDLISGVPVDDPNALLGQMDTSALNATTRDMLKRRLFELSKEQLRQFIKWVTAYNAIPLTGFPRKIKLINGNYFRAHTCSLEFEVWNGGDIDNYEQFKQKFLECLAHGNEGAFLLA